MQTKCRQNSINYWSAYRLRIFQSCFKSVNVKPIYLLLQLPDNSVAHESKTLSLVAPSCAVGLAYLWETTPVLATEALPLYAKDQFRLPGAPWIQEVLQQKGQILL